MNDGDVELKEQKKVTDDVEKTTELIVILILLVDYDFYYGNVIDILQSKSNTLWGLIIYKCESNM